ncbi:MAG TPA: Rpn family recombination-promoting nuclease/putative transposase [Candidatus Parabacteroides faecavium]|nr:Rpn family recombination-promoting nuclease/putative transposase [Candidatus Parabacteroides faecavium]
MEERIVVNIEFMQCRSIFSAIYRIQRLLEAQHAAPLLSQGRLYNLKHMEQLEHLSFKGQKALFVRLEELARIANMNKKERAEYEAALKIYRDNENVVTTARREGKEEGIAIGEERGVLKTARLMKQNGASAEFIKQCTGMTEEEIKNL